MNEYDIVPLGVTIPYTLSDVSVVIPHIERQFERLQWFLKQYVNNTPHEVVLNTLVVYDENDKKTEEELEKYPVQSISSTNDWSTYKMRKGFSKVMTRLCCRVYNDAAVLNSAWAQALVDQFNTSATPQLIGSVHPSGQLSKEGFIQLITRIPWYTDIYKRTRYNLTFYDNPYAQAEYINGYFMASQTYVFRALYAILFDDFHGGSMNVEDLLFSHIASSHNIQIVHWKNINQFIACVKGIPGNKDKLDTSEVKSSDSTATPQFSIQKHE